MTQDQHYLTHNHHSTNYFRWPRRRKILPQRRKLPSVRLGGKNSRRGILLLGLAGLGKLKVKYSRLLKKLRKRLFSLVKEVIKATAAESFQQRILMQTSCSAIPLVGISFNSFPKRP